MAKGFVYCSLLSILFFRHECECLYMLDFKLYTLPIAEVLQIFFAIIPSAALLDGRPHAAAPPPSVLEPRPRFYFIMRIAAFHRVIARVGPLAFHR